MPIARRPAIASRASGLTVSASAIAPSRPRVALDHDRGAAGALPRIQHERERGEGDAGRVGPRLARVARIAPRSPDPYRRAVDPSARTPRPGTERNSSAGATAQATLARRGDDASATGCSEPASAAAASASTRRDPRPEPRPDVRDRQLAGRDGAGLVEHDRVEVLAALEDLGAADQQPEPRAAARADEDRDGRRQAERAGAGDDQHRDRRVHAALEVHRGEHALQGPGR